MGRLTLSMPAEFGPTGSAAGRCHRPRGRPADDGLPRIVRWLACWASGATEE